MFKVFQSRRSPGLSTAIVIVTTGKGKGYLEAETFVLIPGDSCALHWKRLRYPIFRPPADGIINEAFMEQHAVQLASGEVEQLLMGPVVTGGRLQPLPNVLPLNEVDRLTLVHAWIDGLCVEELHRVLDLTKDDELIEYLRLVEQFARVQIEGSQS